MLSKEVGKFGDTIARELELDSGSYCKRISGGVDAFSVGNVGDGPSWSDDVRASVSRFLPLVSISWDFSGGKIMSQLESVGVGEEIDTLVE